MLIEMKFIKTKYALDFFMALMLVCFFSQFSLKASESILEGCWKSNKGLSIEVAKPFLKALPEEKSNEIKSQFEGSYFCVKNEVITFTFDKGADEDSLVRKFRCRILENDGLSMRLKIVGMSSDEDKDIIKIKFIGNDRLWIEGALGIMTFYDRETLKD